ncbi:hypothetical protein LX32DRAFT_146117 [Colletotrichum zoysiae]|uniref:Uncharacterized protein n=1 Tax=Colletotrichum zoysiae TaxID=1216348 RepID=A0AAD9LYW8_9PEZI|nr:hypothetical protein LX32DRAFT_146117 [Colletotrichum zoysiae]
MGSLSSVNEAAQSKACTLYASLRDATIGVTHPPSLVPGVPSQTDIFLHSKPARLALPSSTHLPSIATLRFL